MSDSLTLGPIELLGGGAPSTLAGVQGAVIRLGTSYSLSAPQWTSQHVTGLLFAGEMLTNVRASNRTPVLPVVIIVPPSGDMDADRTTLAAARELVLMTATSEQLRIVWTREGGLPLVLDVQGVTATTVEYSVISERNLCAKLQIECEAYPYGHSDTQEAILLTSASNLWAQPVTPVTVDDFTTASNFLYGSWPSFETDLGQWQPAVNAALTRSNAQAHGGTWSMLLTAVAAGTASARHCAAVDPDVQTNGMWVDPGDTVTLRAWLRATTTPRTVSVGVEFYDASETIVGTATFGTGVADSTSAWTQATASVVAPDGVQRAICTVQVAGAGAGEGHYVDDVWMDAGPVYSYGDPNLWSQSTQSPISGGRSAAWSRPTSQAAVMVRILPAPVDFTGRNKITFYAGLATSAGAAPVFHKGTVNFMIVAWDAAGNDVIFYTSRYCNSSAIPGIPHWQLVTLNVPQVATGFDFTQVVQYQITTYNTWQNGHPVLQASLFLGLITAAATSTGTPGTRALWSTLPGIVGSAPAQVAIQGAPGPGASSTIVEWTTNGTKNWTSPVGVTKLDWAEGEGAGGGGAGCQGFSYPYFGGGGGGAGEYAKQFNLPILANTLYHPVVGLGGRFGSAIANSTNDATGGSDTVFPGNGVTLRCHGGGRGWKSHTVGGGKGGDGSNNDVHYPGGDGWQANAYFEDTGWAVKRGGGGGAAGGTDRAGKDATDYQAAAGAAGGGPGGEGGHIYDSAHGGQPPTSGPGGGGGGGAIAASDNTATGPLLIYPGANGKDGWLRIAYGAGAVTPLLSFLAHMPSADAPLALSPVIPVGNGADTPNGGTSYPVPAVGGLAARFDGTYTMYLIASSFANTGTSRQVTVTINQTPYPGGPADTNQLQRTFTPSVDILNGWVEMGTITLPISALPPGQATAAFTMSVLSGQTGDRYLDILMIDTAGSCILVNRAATGYARLWIDAADRDHDLGGVYGSDADRDRAVSATADVRRWSGGTMTVRPGGHNRLLIYSQQGCPAATLFYVPNWLVDRLS